MTLSATDLFTPTPPGISTQNPTASTPANSWLAILLANAAALGLPTTTWQPGDPLRTMMAIQAVSDSKEDVAIALQAQGGLLDYAASGTVTATDLEGLTTTIAVSPDPSVPGQNPTGVPTWLDLLASSVFNVRRTPAAAAANPVYLVNTVGASLGTFAPGTFHLANFFTGASYSNQVSFTNTASALAGTAISAVTGTGTVTVTTSSAHLRTTGDVVYVTGVKGISLAGLIGSGVTTSSGFCVVTVTSPTAVTLNGVTATGVYTSGGLVYLPQAVSIAADQPGAYGNAGVGAINQLITASPGCFAANLVQFAGANWQSNASLAAYCRAKLATLTPNGPNGAYVFWALAAYLVLSGQALPGSPPSVTQAIANYLQAAGQPPVVNPLPATTVLVGGPITRVLVSLDPHAGTVVTTVANATGPVEGCMNKPVTGASASSPIELTVLGHNCQNGDWAQVNGIQGLSGASGVFQLTRVDVNHVTLNGSTGTGVFTASTGQMSGGDLYALSTVLQAYATPNAVSQAPQSAAAVLVTVGATVYVPRALTGSYLTAVTSVLNAYLGSFPIGGLMVDGVANVLPIGSVEGLIFAAGQQITGQFYTLSVTGVTLNGAANDLVIGAGGVVQAQPFNITVVGI